MVLAKCFRAPACGSYFWPTKSSLVWLRGRQNLCFSPEDLMQADELATKYSSISAAAAKPGWDEVYAVSLEACMHGPNCRQGADCQVRCLHPC